MECIHNIDFDFHYFQFRFIVCKVKHKIEKKSREREWKEKMSKSRENLFSVFTISTLMPFLLHTFFLFGFCCLSFVVVQLKWVQNKMIKELCVSGEKMKGKEILSSGRKVSEESCWQSPVISFQTRTIHLNSFT
jgi:hypothetical protein